MVDPMIPGLHAAVTVAVNELRLTYNEGPGDLYDLVHDAITAAYPYLIAPAVKAACEDMRERCAKDAERTHAPFSALAIRALPLTDPTEPPEAVREADATVAYEVTDHHGDWAASADTLTEAIHYLSVYGQDGPVKLWKVTSVREEMENARLR